MLSINNMEDTSMQHGKRDDKGRRGKSNFGYVLGGHLLSSLGMSWRNWMK